MLQGLLESGTAQELEGAAGLLRDYQEALSRESQALETTLGALRVLASQQVGPYLLFSRWRPVPSLISYCAHWPWPRQPDGTCYHHMLHSTSKITYLARGGHVFMDSPGALTAVRLNYHVVQLPIPGAQEDACQRARDQQALAARQLQACRGRLATLNGAPQPPVGAAIARDSNGAAAPPRSQAVMPPSDASTPPLPAAPAAPLPAMSNAGGAVPPPLPMASAAGAPDALPASVFASGMQGGSLPMPAVLGDTPAAAADVDAWGMLQDAGSGSPPPPLPDMDMEMDFGAASPPLPSSMCAFCSCLCLTPFAHPDLAVRSQFWCICDSCLHEMTSQQPR